MIVRIFGDTSISRMLQHYQQLLSESHITSLEFYTDGSVQNIGTPNCSASFASVHTSIDASRFDFPPKSTTGHPQHVQKLQQFLLHY